MAKQKQRTKPAFKLNIPPTRNQTDPCAQRLSNLAIELTLAGGQVLREDFGFDENQVNLWLDKMLIRAQKNRESNGS